MNCGKWNSMKKEILPLSNHPLSGLANMQHYRIQVSLARLYLVEPLGLKHDQNRGECRKSKSDIGGS